MAKNNSNGKNLGIRSRSAGNLRIVKSQAKNNGSLSLALKKVRVLELALVALKKTSSDFPYQQKGKEYSPDYLIFLVNYQSIKNRG